MAEEKKERAPRRPRRNDTKTLYDAAAFCRAALDANAMFQAAGDSVSSGSSMAHGYLSGQADALKAVLKRLEGGQ